MPGSLRALPVQLFSCPWLGCISHWEISPSPAGVNGLGWGGWIPSIGLSVQPTPKGHRLLPHFLS